MLKKNIIHHIRLFVVLAAGLFACSETEHDLVLYSNAGKNYFDVETEDYKVTLSAEPALEGQTGKWIIYKGENGSFDDEYDPATVFYGEPGESYHLGWEVSVGDQYQASIAEVSFKPLQPVISAEIPDTLHNNVSIVLNAEENKYGATGTWEILEGDGGRFTDPHAAESGFIGKADTDYTIRWVLTYGSKEEAMEASFTTGQLKADGGGNLIDVVTSEDEEKYLSLKAVLPAGATGKWHLTDGHDNGEVMIDNDPNSLFKGVANTEYTLVWEVQLDEYLSSDTIKVLFRGKWGTWTDERDGQTYRYAVINGLEWMADNFNYMPEETQYGRSWYYGQSPRAKVYDGAAIETDEERKYYGRLYNYYAAVEMAPEGWRLPTPQEIDALTPYLGGALYARDRMVEGGDSGLELIYGGTISFGNGSTETFDHFMWQGFGGIYMTSSYNPRRFETLAVIVDKNFSGIVTMPVASYFQGTSVRYVRKIQK